jgi:hypothetical protein
VKIVPLTIKAMGRGKRRVCNVDKFGFPCSQPKRFKRAHGFQTGDMVRAIIPTGKYHGTDTGRIVIRARPSFRLNGRDVHPKYLKRLQRADGYDYAF